MALKEEAWRLDLARYPMRLTLQTRYGDMDSNAHLNNVAIARLFEEARVRFHGEVRSAGGKADGNAAMIVHATIDYVAEGSYPADVEAGIAVAAAGRSSYRLAIGLFQNGDAIALNDSVMVALDPELRTAAPLSAALRDDLLLLTRR